MRLPRRAARGFVPSFLPLEDRITPATFYLDPSTMAGDTIFNEGNPGETTGLNFGTTLFNDLDNALAAASGANDGPDVIQLASANIPIPNGGGLPYGIFQNVTLNGNGPSVLVPTVNTVDGSTSVLLISNGAAVNLSNLTFDGSGFDVGIGIRYDGFGTTGTVSNVAIQNIDFQGDNTAIALFVTTPDSIGTFTRVDVTNSTISNYGATGIYYALALGTVTDSTITGPGGAPVDETYYGVIVDGQTGTGSVTITGTTITGNVGTLAGEPNSAAVLVRGLAGPSSPAVSIFGNQFTGNNTGILVDDSAGGASEVTAKYNNIFNNTTGLNTTKAGTQSFIVADANWWGKATGPANAANPGGTGNPVVGSPVFQPFITRGPVPVDSAASIAAYRIENSTATETTVSDVTTTVSPDPQTLTLTASVSGTNVVGTVTFRVVVFGGAQIGSTVQAAVVNGVATASYTLPGGTLPDFYSIEADFNPGVELLTANTGANGLLRVNPAKSYAAGAGTGSGAGAKVYNPDNSVKFTSNPLGGATTGARVAMADVTGDGIDDLIVGAGPGSQATVVVINGQTQAEVVRFLAFEPTFTGGVYVAAGDIDGDGKAEVIVSPDQGGGPVVAVYRGSALATGTATELVRFFGITDDSFRGGARPAVGDVNGDNVPDVVVSAGFLGGPRIQIWSGAVLATGSQPTESLANFFAFEDTLRNGCFVSVGDVNGDGFADLIFGGGPGGGPRVRIADGKALLAAGGFGTLDNPAVAGLTIANFFAGNDQNRGGVRVSATDLDRDGLSEVFAGSGDEEQSTVRRYDGTAIQASIGNGGNPSPSIVFDPFGVVIEGGVFVG